MISDALWASYEEWWWREIEDRRRMFEAVADGKTVTITVSDVGINGI